MGATAPEITLSDASNVGDLTRLQPESVYRTPIGVAKPGVVLRGVIYGGSGYAQENLPIVLALSRHGLPVQIEPQMHQHDTQNLLPREAQVALEFMKLQPVDLSRGVYFQAVPAHDLIPNVYARKRVCRTMFETDSIPAGWKEKCNQMDEVWVPSYFNYETFLRAGVEEKRLRWMQEGEDTELFRPGHKPFQIPGTRGFNFLSVFQWTQRKGPDVLLKAYVSEFKEDEDVSLILRTYGRSGPESDVLPQLLHYIERELRVPLEKTPPIILLPGLIPNQDVPRLYASADCFVLPTRGEGWGRPYTEALSSEMPVIATRWSGQTDFLTDENSYLIDYREVPTPADVDVEIFAGHRWAEPDVDHCRALMRHVFNHRDEAKQKARQGRKDIVEKHDWSVIMRRWTKEFDRLLA
jgi:glycosyltransferase involved in cell wall biosynthesis